MGFGRNLEPVYAYLTYHLLLELRGLGVTSVKTVNGGVFYAVAGPFRSLIHHYA